MVRWTTRKPSFEPSAERASADSSEDFGTLGILRYDGEDAANITSEPGQARLLTSATAATKADTRAAVCSRSSARCSRIV